MVEPGITRARAMRALKDAAKAVEAFARPIGEPQRPVLQLGHAALRITLRVSATCGVNRGQRHEADVNEVSGAFGHALAGRCGLDRFR